MSDKTRKRSSNIRQNDVEAASAIRNVLAGAEYRHRRYCNAGTTGYLVRFAKRGQITTTKSFQSVFGPEFPNDKKRHSAEAMPASVVEEVERLIGLCAETSFWLTVQATTENCYQYDITRGPKIH
jgi:hypothetical protein